MSLPTVVVPPPPSVILDSGATGTFVSSADALQLQRTVPITNGPTVLSASGTVMTPTHSGFLSLSPLLSDAAQSAFVLDNLKTRTLVSLSQLCDDDCVAIFTRFEVQILKKDKIIITGKRMPNGLWSLPLMSPPLRGADASITIGGVGKIGIGDDGATMVFHCIGPES